MIETRPAGSGRVETPGAQVRARPRLAVVAPAGRPRLPEPVGNPLVPAPFEPIYAAYKHAVVGLVRSLGQVYEPDGIRVHSLCPSFAHTNIIKGSEQTMLDMGFPILAVADVVDAFQRILEADSTGECWYVVAGRPSEPFHLRRAPGPRTD